MKVNVGDEVCVKVDGLWGPIFVPAKVVRIDHDVEWIDTITNKIDTNPVIEVKTGEKDPDLAATIFRCHPDEVTKIN